MSPAGSTTVPVPIRSRPRIVAEGWAAGISAWMYTTDGSRCLTSSTAASIATREYTNCHSVAGRVESMQRGREDPRHRVLRLPLTVVLSGGRAPPEAARRVPRPARRRVARLPAPPRAGSERTLRGHLSRGGLGALPDGGARRRCHDQPLEGRHVPELEPARPRGREVRRAPRGGSVRARAPPPLRGVLHPRPEHRRSRRGHRDRPRVGRGHAPVRVRLRGRRGPPRGAARLRGGGRRARRPRNPDGRHRRAPAGGPDRGRRVPHGDRRNGRLSAWRRPPERRAWTSTTTPSWSGRTPPPPCSPSSWRRTP